MEKEKKTRHEVTAFVQELAEHVGDPEGSYVHWGLTSSDVLDSGLGLLIKEAGEVLQKSFLRLEKFFGSKVNSTQVHLAVVAPMEEQQNL